MPNISYDISDELAAIGSARYGREVRQTIVNALTKLNIFAASIDPSKIQGGESTTVISNGNMFRLEDYPEYNNISNLNNESILYNREILQNAINEAKTLGFPGIMFPRNVEFLIDVSETSTYGIIIPDNFGVDLNGSTIKMYRNPTPITENGDYDISDFDSRQYTIVGMVCNNSFIRNGILDGGSDVVFPESFSKEDGTNDWPGDGIYIDGYGCVVEDITIKNTLSDGIRLDSGRGSKEILGDQIGADGTVEFLFKGKTRRTVETDGEPVPAPSARPNESYDGDFKIDSDTLVSKWIRLSGGHCVPTTSMWLHTDHPSARRIKNGRNVDFIENDVKSLALKYATYMPSDYVPEHKFSIYYTMEFADDSYFEDGDGEGTFNEPTSGTLIPSVGGKIGYEIDFTEFGYKGSSGERDKRFVSDNPLTYIFVNVAENEIESSIFDDDTYRPSKNYYVRNEDGTFKKVDSVAKTDDKSTLYVKHSKLPLVRVKVPCVGLSDLDDLPYLISDYGQDSDIDSFGYKTRGFYGEAWGVQSSFTLCGIIRESGHHTIRNVVIKNSGRNGITLGNTHHTTIENFLISGCMTTQPQCGIDIEEGGYYCHDNNIRVGSIQNCRYGICNTTCQETFVENVIISSCYYSVYAQSNSSLTLTNCTLIQGDNAYTLALLSRTPMYYNLIKKRLINCNIYGPIVGIDTKIDNCFIQTSSILLDKTSSISNSDFYPSYPGSDLSISGQYNNCNFYDFKKIHGGSDYTRDIKASTKNDKFINCNFDCEQFDFVQTATPETSNNDLHPCPVDHFSGCNVTCTTFSGLYSRIVSNSKFFFTNKSVYTMPRIRASLMEGCIFDNGYNGSITDNSSEPFAQLSVVSIKSASEWNPGTMIVKNNVFKGLGSNVGSSTVGRASAIRYEYLTGSNDSLKYSLQFTNNSCLTDSEFTENIKTVTNGFSDGNRPTIIGMDNYGFRS